MSLTAYSAVATDAIPAGAKIVFAYANPPFAQIEAVHARCPQAKIIPTVTHPNYMGEMYDFENGALPVDTAGTVIRQAFDRGARRPIIYFAISNRDVIVKSLKAKSIRRTRVRLLPADFNPGVPVPNWADGLQRIETINGHQVNVYELRNGFFGGRAPLLPLAARRW